MVLAVLGLMPR